jgi:hypothetical protein
MERITIEIAITEVYYPLHETLNYLKLKNGLFHNTFF